MAKMTVEFDTDTKKMTASIDGKAVEHVRAAEVYPSWDKDDEFRCVFVTRATDEKTNITEIRQLVAAETNRAKAAVKDGSGVASAEYPGFVELKTDPDADKLTKSIAAMFGCGE